MDQIIFTCSLCCPPGSTCPKVEFFESGNVDLSEDGEQIRLTKEELQKLVDAARVEAGWDIK